MKWKWDQSDQSPQISVTQRKSESLSELFGSCWANKVKINAYYKTMKVFFDLACMSTCCWGLPKPKYEPFITHNRGTLIAFKSVYCGYVFSHGKHFVIFFNLCVCVCVCGVGGGGFRTFYNMLFISNSSFLFLITFKSYFFCGYVFSLVLSND